jgi:hypothetical protein
VRPSVQGDREAYPKRWLPAASCDSQGDRRFDRSELVEGGDMAETYSILKTLTPMHTLQAYVGRRSSPLDSTADGSAETAQALSVVVVYQDPLTHYWATDLWDRVGLLIDSGGICRKTWKLGDLTRAFAFADAVEAAAGADVLVISVRDAGELPLLLHVWVDAWMPRRAGRPGALVALIGVPSKPDALSGRAHQYLEATARQAGLDFLPRERRLPEEALAFSTLSGMAPANDGTMPWPGGGPGRGASARLQWRVNE